MDCTTHLKSTLMINSNIYISYLHYAWSKVYYHKIVNLTHVLSQFPLHTYVFMHFMCTSDSEYEQKAHKVLLLLLTLLLPSSSACCDSNAGHDCNSGPPLQQRTAKKHYMKILNARKWLWKRPPSFKLSVWMPFYWSKRFDQKLV